MNPTVVGPFLGNVHALAGRVASLTAPGVSNVGDSFHETSQYATVAIFHTLTSGPFAPQFSESDWNPSGVL